MTNAAADDDPQLDRFLEQIRRQYEADAGFKEQVRSSVKTQSESYLKSVIEHILGAIGASVLRGLMRALTRIFG